jgi:hypothetical protein
MTTAKELARRLRDATYQKVVRYDAGTKVVDEIRMDRLGGSPHPNAFAKLKNAVSDAREVFGDHRIGPATRTVEGLRPNNLRRSAFAANKAVLVWLVNEAERLANRLEKYRPSGL